jgi:hypothetical protein
MMIISIDDAEQSIGEFRTLMKKEEVSHKLDEVNWSVINGFVRLFQDMSRFDRKNKVMYIPPKTFDKICFDWLTHRGYWIKYPQKESEE